MEQLELPKVERQVRRTTSDDDDIEWRCRQMYASEKWATTKLLNDRIDAFDM